MAAIGWARAPEALQPAKAVAAAVLARVCLAACSFNMDLDPQYVAASLTARLARIASVAMAAGTPSAHASGVAALEAVAALAGDERTRGVVGLPVRPLAADCHVHDVLTREGSRAGPGLLQDGAGGCGFRA
jgi:hypothetical protein